MNVVLAHSITKNTTVLFTSQMVTWASSFVLMLFLPRYLGSVEYGQLYLATSLVMIAHLVIDFGGGYFIPKEVARSRGSAASLASHSLMLRLGLWFLTFSGLLVFAWMAGYPSSVRAVITILGFATLWEGASKMVRSCFQGFEKLEYSAVGSITERVFVTAAGISALLLGADVVMVSLIMACSTLLNALISFWLLKGIIHFRLEFTSGEGWRILKAGVPYFLWSVFAVVYYRIDAVMMSLMTPPHVVGWYGAAYRFFDVLMFLPVIFTTAVFPILARLWKEEAGVMRRATGRSLELIVMAGIPVSFCTFLYARDIIGLFFGLEEYAQAAPLLQLFAIGLLLVYIDMVLGTVILASDKQKEWSIVALSAIPLNIGLNFVLIPLTQSASANGGVGAALATLLTECAVMIAAIRLTPAQCFESFKLSVVVKAVGSGIQLVLIAMLLQSLGIPWILQAAFACLAYVFSLHVLEVFEPAEVAFLRDFFSVRNLRRMILARSGGEA